MGLILRLGGASSTTDSKGRVILSQAILPLPCSYSSPHASYHQRWHTTGKAHLTRMLKL